MADDSIAAVIFDLDGVLVDSEPYWEASRHTVVTAAGGRWRDGLESGMKGMSSEEWAAYLQQHAGLEEPIAEIIRKVVDEMGRRMAAQLPEIAGADAVVRRLADRWPLAVASSSPTSNIGLALRLLGVEDRFVATVSSDEVGHGKPRPDVYLEAARRLGIDPTRGVAIEDSPNGVRAARDAGLAVIAYVPRPDDEGAAAVADAATVAVGSLDEISVDLVAGLAAT